MAIRKKVKNNYLSSRIEKLLEELDWDCDDQIHHYNSLNILHWYPGSFITAIPSNIIEIFSNETDVIWDPFCGSGITATESFRTNRKFYGNDINEISRIITIAKLKLIEHLENFAKHFKAFKSYLEVKELESKFSNTIFPITNNVSIKDIKPWYSKEVLSELSFLYHQLQCYEIPDNLEIIYKVVFLNIAKLACAQQKTWGHIADNVLPKKSQILERKYNVVNSYIKRVNQIINRAQRLFVFPKLQSYRIEQADSLVFKPDEKVDLVITSPPYPQMNDYITAHRLGYYWLNISKEEINELKKTEIGARYRRHTKYKYEKYYKELTSSFDNIIQCIKKDGILAIIMPDYEKQDPRRDVINKIYKHLSSKLFKMYQINRNIDLNRRWAPFRRLKNESLTIWCKNG